MFVAMPRRHLLILFVAFGVSLFVRWPLLNRPLSGHHELCTALVLIALDNWHRDGFTAHHGAPAITFTGPADRIPPGYTDAPALRDGVLYYLSHPPLAFDLPHLFFSLSDSAPNALGLQLFNLLFHLFTAIGLYLIVRELRSDGPAPLFAALLYLFMPSPLWFHGNAYMSDMFVQNAWVWHVLLAFRALKNDQGPSWRMAAWCGVTLLLTTAISWPGVWAGVALCGIAHWRFLQTRDPKFVRLYLIAIVAVGIGLVYTIARWLQIVDADSLLAYLTGRYSERGSTGIHGAKDILSAIALNYRINWLPLALPLILFAWWMRTIRSSTHGLTLFVLLTALPSLLEHAFLLEYTLHDFTTLKAGLLLSGVAGLGIAAIRARWSWAALALTCVGGVLYFYRTNALGSGLSVPAYQDYEVGAMAARMTGPDEMVFTLGFAGEPQMQWPAGHTLFHVRDRAHARAMLNEKGLRRGVIIKKTGLFRSLEWVEAEP